LGGTIKKKHQMAQINGIKLPAGLGASLGGTPEEAAKAFMKAASLGMARVMVDAVNSAIGEAVGNVGGPAPDWTKHVRNCVMDMQWETPPGTPVQIWTGFAGAAAGQPSLGWSFEGCVKASG
jgi:hypothetical protein